MSEALDINVKCQECGNYMDIIIYADCELPTYICPTCDEGGDSYGN